MNGKSQKQPKQSKRRKQQNAKGAQQKNMDLMWELLRWLILAQTIISNNRASWQCQMEGRGSCGASIDMVMA